MSFTTLPVVAAGDFIRSSWAALVKGDLDDHETRIVAVEAGASVQTLTNKTLDAEAAGNLITLSFVYWWPLATGFDVGGSPGAYEDNGWAAPQSNYVIAVGTNTVVASKGFPDATSTSAWNNFLLPSDWTGAVDVKFLWYTSATSGNVVWQIQTASSAITETLDPAWNTANTVTQAAQGTTNRLNIASITGITTTGCAAAELMHLKVTRDAAHVSDTLAAQANLIGIEFKYRRAI